MPFSCCDRNFQVDCSKDTVLEFNRIKTHLASRTKHSQTDSNEKCPDAEITRPRISAVEFESLDDVADLVEFSKHADKNPKVVSWTVNDAMRIIRPFIGLAPQDWPTESERVQLLLSLEVPDSKAPKELLDFMSGPLEEYEAKWMFPVDGCLSRAHITISLNDIFSVIKPLAEKEWCAWTEDEVENVVQVLGGGPAIDAQGVTPEADSAWWQFYDKWEQYLINNPAIKRRVDPYCVFINVMGKIPPPGLDASFQQYPPRNVVAALRAAGALSPPVNGCLYVRSFATQAAASHFVGWMQSRFADLRAWVTKGGAMPVYY